MNLNFLNQLSKNQYLIFHASRLPVSDENIYDFENMPRKEKSENCFTDEFLTRIF